MLTTAELETINAAWRAAFERFNSIASPKVVFSDATRDIVCAYLRSQNISSLEWVEQVFFVGLGQTYNDLEKVKTRAQLEQEKAQADRAAGQTRYRKDGETTTPKESSMHDAMNLVEGMLRGEKPGTDVPKAETTAVAFPPLDKDVENMEPADRKLFRALSPDNMRKWLAKRREFQLAEAQANARPMTGNVRLKGEGRG